MNRFNQIVIYLLTGLCLCDFAKAQAVSHELNFSPNELKISYPTINNEIRCQIDYKDYLKENKTGYPGLPYIIKHFIVPDNGGNIQLSSDVSTPKSFSIDHPVNIAPEQIPTASRQTKATQTSSIYQETFPQHTAEIISEGYLDGDKRIVGIKIYPVQYVPNEQKILLWEQISLNLSFSQKIAGQKTITSIQAPPRTTEELQKMLQFVENQNDIARFSNEKSNRNITLPIIPSYEYVIITTDDLVSSFEPLVRWRRQQGINAGIVTMQTILSYKNIIKDSYSNLYDDAGKLREFLRLAYTAGTKYALLAGDSTRVPFRYGTPINRTETTEYHPKNSIPTDLYFSDLNSNWNTDNDQHYGEPTDHLDFYPEIYVGRLLCSTPDEVDNYLDKLFLYEQNPGRGDYTYLKKAFYAEADQMQEQKQAEKLSEIFSETFTQNTIFQEKEGPRSPTLPTFPTGKDVINEMNQGYGFYSWHLHGEPVLMVTASRLVNNGAYYLIIPTPDCWQSNDTTGNSFMDLTNYDKPAVAYTISCTTMPYDSYMSVHSYENYKYNLGEAYTVGSKGGGPAYLGNTREGYIIDSFDLQRIFTKALLADKEHELGRNEAISKYQYSDHYISLVHNMLGCPKIKMWTEIPQTISANAQINNSALTVSANIPEARITVAGIFGNDFLESQIGNNTTFDNLPDNYIVTVSKENHLPYTLPLYIRNITLNSQEYLKTNLVYIGNGLDSSSDNGSVTLQSGAQLRIDTSDEVIVNTEFTVESGAELEIRTLNP